ncbi:MAG: phosphoribosylamine--glycine ligase [Candidatus Omnitrophota bacterium]|nr:MAG: phosphoribosylamine--glycine ligase [Candidatus Omnitrophota bacterium]
MKVLVIGSGGREHCLAKEIAESSLVDKVYCAPGNAGTSLCAENVDIGASDIDRLFRFAVDKKIDLTVPGPEVPLVNGIVDKFQEANLKIFGPTKKAAMLEASKVFAKEVMRKYRVPTADFKVFDDHRSAKEYIKTKFDPLVIKADGLAAGKGVIVCQSQEQANAAVDEIMVQKKFGSAGFRIVVEDYLQGEEASILVFTDGRTIVPLVSSQDHKQIFDGDKGPNTGGMGAYAPAPVVEKRIFTKIINKVFLPLIEGLKQDGIIYKGILYAGIMIEKGEPYVLEFNVRFGDPETQAVLPKLKSDLVEVMLKTINGDLKNCRLEWDERFCLCVVLASGGYPGSYAKGKQIYGLDKLTDSADIFVFHAGTQKTRDQQGNLNFFTNGGRVLNVVALGETVLEAQRKVYSAIEKISFENMYYRRDIGYKAVKCKK